MGCSNDLALRLQEEPFVTAYPLGWRYECVWETVTRQDAELLLKVFRAVCCGGDGCCELLQLQLQTILSIMDAIVEKAKSCKFILLSRVQRRLCPTYPTAAAASEFDFRSRRDAHASQHQHAFSDPLHYSQNRSGSRALPPERDNYRFLVLREEVGDSLCHLMSGGQTCFRAEPTMLDKVEAATDCAQRPQRLLVVLQELQQQLCGVKQDLKSSQESIRQLQAKVAADTNTAELALHTLQQNLADQLQLCQKELQVARADLESANKAKMEDRKSVV